MKAMTTFSNFNQHKCTVSLVSNIVYDLAKNEWKNKLMYDKLMLFLAIILLLIYLNSLCCERFFPLFFESYSHGMMLVTERDDNFDISLLRFLPSIR